MNVELDAFSGRPNPRWTLEASTAAEVASMLKSLPTTPPVTLESRLGYRGFILHGGDYTATVFDGLVRLDNGGESHWFKDTAGIEAALRADAAKHGFSSIMGVAPKK